MVCLLGSFSSQGLPPSRTTLSVLNTLFSALICPIPGHHYNTYYSSRLHIPSRLPEIFCLISRSSHVHDSLSIIIIIHHLCYKIQGCYRLRSCAAPQHTLFSLLSQSANIICILKAHSPLRSSLRWPIKTVSLYPLQQKILPSLRLPRFLIATPVSPPSMTSYIIITLE